METKKNIPMHTDLTVMNGYKAMEREEKNEKKIHRKIGDSHIVQDNTAITIEAQEINLESDKYSRKS